MDAAKPGSWIKEPEPPKSKKPFVLQPHLTSRPLSGNAALSDLRKTITKKGGKK